MGSGPEQRGTWSLVTVLLLVVSGIGACGRSPQPATGASTGGPRQLYPAPASERLVRVLLQDGQSDYLLSLEGPFDVFDPNTGERLGGNEAGAVVDVVFTPAGIQFSAPRILSELQVVDILPRQMEPVGVYFGTDLKRYQGWLRVGRTSESTGCVVNVLDVEDYLVSVVASELDIRYQPETFKTQAIIARTYAWYQKQMASRSQLWDLSATQRSQVYGDLDRARLVVAAEPAVRATEGVVCTWHSPEGPRIFCTYYSSMCGGSTESANGIRRQSEIPPLAGEVHCPCCETQPGCQWGGVRLSKAMVTQLLRDQYAKLRDLGMIVAIEVRAATRAGRPISLSIRDDQGQSKELEVENFRLALDPTGRLIRSTLFTLSDEGSDLVFQDGRGFGHGVGLCQRGADVLAQRGQRAGQILSWYYPGSRLIRAY